LAFLYRLSMRFLSLRHHRVNLIGVLLLRNVVRRVMLWLMLRRHILRCQQSDW
jgi:hypothetical protein